MTDLNKADLSHSCAHTLEIGKNIDGDKILSFPRWENIAHASIAISYEFDKAGNQLGSEAL